MADSNILHLSFADNAAPLSWPAVSLCMIVKNEEDNLADCLTSVGDFVSEIIVVDTGSTDRTVQIAQLMGARVIHFSWIDDFAAARNQSLKYAAGDWIFLLDADDRVVANECIRLKNVVASNQADAYFCRVVSAVGDGSGNTTTISQLRLFRNYPGIQFQNPIHEEAVSSMLRLGLTLAHTNAGINHAGYVTDPESMRARGRRNEKIIRKVMGRKPGDYRFHYYLATALQMQGDYSGTIEQIQLYLEGLRRSSGGNRENDHRYHAHLLLISACDKLGNKTELLQALDWALEIFPDRRHLWTLAGLRYLKLDMPKEAVAALEQAIRLSPDSDAVGFRYQPGILEKYLSRSYMLMGNRQTGLGQTIEYFAQGALADANNTAALEQLAEVALANGISPPAALRQQAQQWIRLGELNLAERLLHRHVSEYPTDSEAYKLLAVTLQKLGREEEAAQAWQKNQGG